jgi:alpha-acetolactate decarboxylase
LNKRVAALALELVLTACGTKSERSARPAAVHTALEKPPRATGHAVRWYGALRAIMHEGRTQASVKLADVIPGPHAWGLGALEGLHGEVTVLDDVVWLARPAMDGSAATVRADLAKADSAVGAALFVVAKVEAWEEMAVREPIAWDRLDSFLAAELVARGLPLDVPVALRIEGPVALLKWHVVDGSKLVPKASHAEHARTAVRGVLAQANARLVGFHSTDHQGVFTHAGSHCHFHVVVDDPQLSGHVDEVVLQPGARLSFAVK